jgi:hypothetical protein
VFPCCAEGRQQQRERRFSKIGVFYTRFSSIRHK